MREGGVGNQFLSLSNGWKTVKEKNVNWAFLCKVSRINGTKGQRERERERERIVCELLQRKKPATECAFKSSCVKPKRDTTFPRVYFEWTGSRILIFSHATNLPLPFVFPCCELSAIVATTMTNILRREKLRHDRIQSNKSLKSNNCLENICISIKDLAQKYDATEQIVSFAPFILSQKLLSNDPPINRFKTDSEKEKRKKGINFKTSTILKYSKGLKNTCSQ